MYPPPHITQDSSVIYLNEPSKTRIPSAYGIEEGVEEDVS
jgi:hypothetical protein